jgi:hypothetical protein
MLRAIWYYVWVAPHLVLIAVLWVMVRRGILRRLPIFFSYVLFEAVQFGALFFLRQTRTTPGSGYFQFYAVGLALSTVLRFGVILEAFGELFQGRAPLTVPARTFGRFATLTLLGSAILLAALSPGVESDWLKHTIHGLDRAVSILQCGLVISLLLFSRYFALSGRGYAFGVALGLGVLASVELATSAIRLYGIAGSTFCDLVTMGTYHVCVLIWLFYFWKSERPDKGDPKGTPTVLPKDDLELWNRELERLLQ